MSGVEVYPDQEASTGKLDKQGKQSYTVTLNCIMDDPADEAQQVIEYCINEGYGIGIPYRLGNGGDDFAFLQSISPRRVPQSAAHWKVALEYAPPDDRDPQQTPGGGYSEDPTEWRWDIQMGYATWQEPVWRAWNETPFPNHPSPPIGAYTRAGGTYGPVVSSAGVVLDPPLMRDQFDRILQVTCFSLEFDDAVSDAYMGYINNDTIQYSDVLRTIYGVKEHANGITKDTVKCTNATAGFRTCKIGRRTIGYWAWNWEFRYRVGAWWEEVLDRGITARGAGGMDDGIDGQFPGTLPTAAAPIMPVVDGIGRRVPELVLLDGAGRPATAGSDAEKYGVYFTWRKEYRADFATIPFPIFKEA